MKMKKRLFIGKSKTKVVIVFLLLFLLTSLPVAFAVELNQTLTYDGNGNLINGDGKYRVYNEFNQLIKIYNGSNASIQGWMEEYVWHPTEDRILIKYINTDYGENQVADEVVVYITEDFTRWYDLHGIIEINDTYYIKDDMGIVGEIVFNGTDNNPNFDFVKRLFYHGDHLGSTSVITNQSGDLVEETFYEPFGAIIGGGEIGRFTYEGREFSELTGDYDFRFRKYNPEIGVFTQPDALIPNVYDPQSLNRYRFERNNPYRYVDKDGKFAIAAPLLIAAGFGFAGGAITYFATTSPSERTVGGFFAYAGGGALGGVIAVGAVLAAPTAFATTAAVLGGAAGGATSQAISNVGTGQPIDEDFLFSLALGGATGGLGQKYLPFARIKSIKYSSSYFSTKTGKTFIADTFAQQSTQTVASILYSSLSSGSGSSSASSNIDLSKGTSSSAGDSTSTSKTGGGSVSNSRSSSGISNVVNKVVNAVKNFFGGLFKRR